MKKLPVFICLLLVIPSQAVVIYVDANATGASNGSSWSDAYKYLQDALADANSAGDVNEIRVAQGIYTPDTNSADPNGSGDRKATFQLINGVAFRGGFSGFGQPDPNARDIELYETVLSGDLDDNDTQLTDPADMWLDPNRQDNSERVVTGSGTDANTTMDGFTITAGYNSNWGAAMYIQDANLIVTNCTFKWNCAEHGAGIINWNSNPELINCKFESNAAAEGAGILDFNSNPLLTDCTFKSNIAMYSNGGAILGGAPEINNCTFTENVAEKGGALCDCDGPIINCSFADNAACWEEGYSQGGGLYGCDGNIVNCTITGNSAEGRGGGLAYCNGPIINCTIANNTSDEDGGGLFFCNGAITNCTITGNSAGFFGGGGLADCRGTIKNCTITENTATDGGGLVDCRGTITNCTIAGNSAPFGGGGGMSACGGTIKNCTITENTAYDGGGIFWCDDNIVNCIIWNNSAEQHSQLYLYFHAELTYSCIQDFNNGGLGNISADPCFVEPGFWVDANDPNIIVEPNDPNAVWVNGDYHLKSIGWRWDAARQRWTWDNVTSRCIDAGNPGSPLGDEPLSIPDDPNNEWGQNLRINMGAFGGTAQASIPPYDWALLADLTNDGTVDLEDYAYQALDWLNSADQQPGDLNRDSLIDFSDLALLVDDWLEQTSWH